MQRVKGTTVMAFPATNQVFSQGSQENTVSLPVEHIQAPPFHQTFFKGQPKALGAVQISLGLVQILVGTVLLYTFAAYTSITAYCFIVYWGGAWYIISGSVTVAAAEKTSRSLVKGTLGTNVISSLIALCEVSLVIVDLARTYYYRYGPCFPNPCSLFQNTILIIRLITLIHLLLITFLQFSMSASAVAFSIRSLKQKTPTVPQVMIVQNPNPTSF
ncbi:membrane-spanning 4-domains subfamily A member 8-like isoform X1 [Ranitomeya imitator]|uniref:membrane-spanning 4-domains subfamily A member 8-like isoform X1 n=2 Tax=Ranitomeya imitator TaxID=111125 RepID=UPI0037E82ADB